MSGAVPHYGERQAIDATALLLTCLRGLPFTVPESTDWRAFLLLAETHGLLPLASGSLAAQGMEIPANLAGAAREARAQAESLARELKTLLEAFSRSNIEVLPIKGPAMALALYGDPALRSCDDLDLLVRREDFAAAGELLSRLGFAAPESADDYHRKFVRGPLLVELHYRLASPRSFLLATGEVWRRSSRETFLGQPMRALAADDLVLFLCLHALKHGFARLIWTMDIAAALHRLRAGEERALFRRAERMSLGQVLFMGCEIARQAGQPLPPAIEQVIAGAPRAAEQARRALGRILSEPPVDRHDPDIWRLYLQTEPGTLRQWIRRIGFLRTTVEDRKWVKRKRVWPGLAPLLRPIRLLRKYGPSRVWRVLFPPQR